MVYILIKITEQKKDMKYRDLITIIISIIFILSLAYVAAVDSSLWYISVIIFIIFLYISYKLWIEK
jgi:hypothetical protein